MSTVRMCDRCGRIFSEREDYQHYDGVSIKTDAGGRRFEVRETMDACADCSLGRARPELEGADKKP